jgi:hypothetical protein
MTAEPHFIFSYLPFWVPLYALAVLAWTSVGRFMMQVFVAPDSPNYIWRFFRLLTDWWLRAIRTITPLYVSPFYLPLLAALWAFALRFVFAITMFALGLAPRISELRGG